MIVNASLPGNSGENQAHRGGQIDPCLCGLCQAKELPGPRRLAVACWAQSQWSVGSLPAAANCLLGSPGTAQNSLQVVCFRVSHVFLPEVHPAKCVSPVAALEQNGRKLFR